MTDPPKLRRYSCTLSQEEIDIIQRLLTNEEYRLHNMSRDHPDWIEIMALLDAFGGFNVKVDIEGITKI